VIGDCLPRKGHRRRAFTLLEVMLTMCLLVILAAMAWPSLQKPFAGMRLRKAADQIRAEWTTARVEAMNSGQTYLFRYAPNEDRFRVEGYSPEQAQGYSAFGTALGETGPGLRNTATVLAAREDILPEGVTFVASETAVDTRAALMAAEMEQSDTGEGGWSDPILFYPDGTTSTVRLVLKNADDRYIEVQLRGFTGVITISEVRGSLEAVP
jgi:prepilin-type N-terminal cleavage/methylation domain-containing protein